MPRSPSPRSAASVRPVAGPVARWGSYGLAGVVVAAAVVAAFWPSLWNGFNYDDDANIVENPHYRGLAPANLRWMFTTFHMGHYQPLSWVTLALDYLIWGERPFGYHLTNLVLHVGNALAVFVLALWFFQVAPRIRRGGGVRPGGATDELSRGSGDHRSPAPPAARYFPLASAGPGMGERWIAAAAALAALLFAVHPLRVESVAWVTERRDVQSSLLLILTVLLYLHAQTGGAARRRMWLAAALGSYVLSLLSRAMGVTLPLILLLLDWYPLGRLGGGRGRWLGRDTRRVWLEKVPFLILAVFAAALAPAAQIEVGAAVTLENHPPLSRVGQACWGLVFYLWKTLWPARLVALYELYLPSDPFQPKYVSAVGGAAAAGLLLVMLRRRAPALVLVAACYAVLLAPVLGFVQSGQQEVADRYSYLPMIGWSVLGVAAATGIGRPTVPAPRRMAAVLAAGGVVVGVCGVLTWRQCRVWASHETLWAHAVRVGLAGSIAHHNLGSALAKQGRLEEAIPHYLETLRINPGYPDTCLKLGKALLDLGRVEESLPWFQRELKLNPRKVEAWYGLARAQRQLRRDEEARAHYLRSLEIDPGYVPARRDLALLLSERGQLEAAAEHMREVVRLRPDDARDRIDLGQILLRQGHEGQAAEQFAAAVALGPRDAAIHEAIGRAYLVAGRAAQALAHLERAVGLGPAHAGARVNLGLALARSGRPEAALSAYEEALRIDPALGDAHYNRGVLLAELGRLEEAITSYQAALRSQPTRVEAHIMLGNAWSARGDLEAAARSYEAALAIDASNRIARFNLAGVLERTGRRDQAIVQLRRVLEIDPHFVEARRQLEALLTARPGDP